MMRRTVVSFPGPTRPAVAAVAAVAAVVLAACGGGTPTDRVAPAAPGTVEVRDAFIPEPPLGTGALYATFVNGTDHTVRLEAIDSDAFSGALYHGRGHADAGLLTLGPGASHTLVSGGDHVMFFDAEGLAEGGSTTVRFTFGGGSAPVEVVVAVPVAAIGATVHPSVVQP